MVLCVGVGIFQNLIQESSKRLGEKAGHVVGKPLDMFTLRHSMKKDLKKLMQTLNDPTHPSVTETAREIFGKHRQKQKTWITAEILDLCDKRRELRKKRFEPEGSEKYKEVNNNIMRCMNKKRLDRRTIE